MGQGIVVAILSFLLYLTNLLGGNFGQPVQPVNPPTEQQSYYILGQAGEIVAERITIRNAPGNEASPLGTVIKDEKVLFLDKHEDWYKIRVSTGLEGWIPEYAVTILQTKREQGGRLVLGYYTVDERAYETLVDQARNLNGIIPLGWQLDSYGQLQEKFEPKMLGQGLYFAGNQEMDTLANLQLTANPSRLLATPQLQRKTISEILNVLENWGLKGVLLDLTYLPGTEQMELFNFVGDLSAALKQEGYQTLLALPWDEELDYEFIGAKVDYLVLKSFKDLYENNPGPVASTTTIEQMLNEITSKVTADKVILAINTGGYDWPRAGVPTALTHKEVLELAAAQGASVKWDPESKSPYFHYGAGHIVWYENRYSLKYKLELVEQYELAGIALRNLGDEDPEVWKTLTNTF